MPSPTPFWKQCFNPNVLIGLGVVAVLALLIFPGKEKVTAFLPFLLVLACPLSMIFMMRGMKGGSCDHEQHQQPLKDGESNQQSNQLK